MTNTADLIDISKKTICLFVPYSKLLNLPLTEIRKIKQKASLGTRNPGLFYQLAKHFNCDLTDLKAF